MARMDSKIEKFSIKSFYLALVLRRLMSFPMGVIWNSWVLTKLSFIFAWK